MSENTKSFDIESNFDITAQVVWGTPYQEFWHKHFEHMLELPEPDQKRFKEMREHIYEHGMTKSVRVAVKTHELSSDKWNVARHFGPMHPGIKKAVKENLKEIAEYLREVSFILKKGFIDHEAPKKNTTKK